MNDLTFEKLQDIIVEAKGAAYNASKKYFDYHLDGVDSGECGFAWVNIRQYDGQKIDGRTSVGKMLKRAGIHQDFRKVFQLGNPAGFPAQNIDVLYAGAKAAGSVFSKYGFIVSVDCWVGIF